MIAINKVLSLFGWTVQRYKAERPRKARKLHHTQTPEFKRAQSERQKAAWQRRREAAKAEAIHA